MALAAGPERQVGKLVVTNIGLLLSGALEAAMLDADTIVCEAGRIVAVGKRADCDTDDARVTIDAHGCAISQGLIDSHVHPVFGDWTPRQGQFGWIDSFLRGGVATMVWAGEMHLHNGNELAGLAALRFARELGQLARAILGTDGAAGSGVLRRCRRSRGQARA